MAEETLDWQKLDEQGPSETLDSAEGVHTSPHLQRETLQNSQGSKKSHGSDNLAETVFKAYWQGFQYATDRSDPEDKPQAALQELQQKTNLSSNHNLAPLLDSWYKTGRTSQYFMQKR